MALDPTANLVKVTASAQASGDTTVTLSTSDATKLPSPSFNMTWWNVTDYADPSDDPSVEIVRVTNVNTGTGVITVTRGQESTAAANHNTGGKTYKLLLGVTSKMISDISNLIAAYAQNHFSVDSFTTSAGQNTFTAGGGRTPLANVLLIINGQPLSPSDWTNPTSTTIRTVASDYPAGLSALWLYFY